ncbi:hypothetical protein D2E26_0031 [Bifidobacterium dolichotidis]|uniref:Uncharacterized protein n=1 Tax=Bifidobacterium dolichotidis TaxID=2306976 RepID=A0A430FRH3_9BIFI|nr:hypothetical protein [Bifidobacterium dolichotidis]RSX55468.1 hypothetical protein D2E26_0031 [Bifidobacterium dolichotidis]
MSTLLSNFTSSCGCSNNRKLNTTVLRGIAVGAICCCITGILPTAGAMASTQTSALNSFEPQYTDHGCVRDLGETATRTFRSLNVYKTCLATEKVLDEYRADGWHVRSWRADISTDWDQTIGVKWFKVAPAMDILAGSRSDSYIIMGYGKTPGDTSSQRFSGDIDEKGRASTLFDERPAGSLEHYELPDNYQYISVQTRHKNRHDLVDFISVRLKYKVHFQQEDRRSGIYTTHIHNANL